MKSVEGQIALNFLKLMGNLIETRKLLRCCEKRLVVFDLFVEATEKEDSFD